MNDDILLFDAVVGHGCNFRCSYCSEYDGEHSYTDTAMSDGVAARYAEYLKYMRELTPDKYLSVQFYGGEPLLYFDQIKQIIAGARNAANVYNIVTNGSLITEHTSELANLKSAATDSLGTELMCSVSYDFTFQNENRQADTYDMVRDAIRWLYGQNMLRKTITVLDKNTLPRIDEVFFDFIALREECPGIHCGYNLDLSGDLSGFDSATTEAALSRIRDWLRKHPEHYGSFWHNTVGSHSHECDELHIQGNIVSCVDIDGGLFPICSALYQSEELRPLLRYGSIFDDFAELNARQEEAVKGSDLFVLEKCSSCKTTCKAPLYSSYDQSGKRIFIASDESCSIRNLVHSYLGEFR